MLINDWKQVLSDFWDDNFQNFLEDIYKDYDSYKVYPPKEDIFKAFQLTSYKDVKVVILGQDPYHQFGQANGLAFSVGKEVKLPPSLKNIFKEINRDLHIENISGDLTSWAMQGVLLLNSSLTVRDSKPNFYSKSLWKSFTNEVIRKVSKKKDIIFLLWGNDAKEKISLIEDGNIILETTHPSPLSFYRGFDGCGHFSKANQILESLGKTIINWRTYDN